MSLPLACVVVRVLYQAVPLPPFSPAGVGIGVLAYLWLLCLKVLMGIVLLGRACERWQVS